MSAQYDRNEIFVGRDFGGQTSDITPELVATYIAGAGDDNPWYRESSPLGGPVAPALILHSAVYRTLDWYLSIYGNLHARQEWDLFAPVKVGERLTTRSVIVARYFKRDREYVVNEVIVTNATGQIVSRSRTHQSFLRDAGKPREGFVIDRAREKDAKRSFKIGERGRHSDAPHHRGNVHGVLGPGAQLP
jgi:acyl dehydratase